MSRFLWISLIFPIMCSCDAAETERPDKGRSDVLILRAAGLAKEGGESKGAETPDPELGEFIFMPGGEFTMGCNNGEDADERPEHVVELSPFYIGKTPVTNLQFVRFLNESQAKPKEYLYSQMLSRKPAITFTDGEWKCVPSTGEDAACCETWRLAKRYCDWLSTKSGLKCRLPTEAEWEYVCRGKEGRKFPWGDSGLPPFSVPGVMRVLVE